VRRPALNEVVRHLVDINRCEIDERRDELPRVGLYSIELSELGDSGKILFGLVDFRTGVPITEPRFSYVGKFSEGVAPCEIGEKVGIVKNTGEYLIEPTDEYSEISECFEGYMIVSCRNGKKRIFSVESKDFFKGEYDKVNIIAANSTGVGMPLFNIYDEGRHGLLRADGIWLVSCENAMSFQWPSPNLLRLTNETTGCESILNVVTNELIISNAREITEWEGGYFSYFVSDGTCTLYKLNGDRGEVLAAKYNNYSAKDESFFMCEFIDNDGHKCFDLYDVERREIVARGVANYESFTMGGTEYHRIYTRTGVGIAVAGQGIIFPPTAQEIETICRGRIKVRDNDLYGIFNLETGKWDILPQYEELSGPDECGHFLMAKFSCFPGRFRRVEKLWRYTDIHGKLLFKEEFLKAEPFGKDRCAKVKRLNGEVVKLRD